MKERTIVSLIKNNLGSIVKAGLGLSLLAASIMGIKKGETEGYYDEDSDLEILEDSGAIDDILDESSEE